MTLPLLTLTMPQEIGFLQPELRVVDRHFHSEGAPHPARRFEYAMALRAFEAWEGLSGGLKDAPLDVGGAGSPFANMLTEVAGWTPTVVDPTMGTGTVEEFGESRDAVFCISVIEHVEEVETFCDHLARVTQTGGLLFLTFDIWGEPPEQKDIAMYSWMRKRIYTVESWKKLAEDMHKRGFGLLGSADWTYAGSRADLGYSFGTLALMKGTE